MKFLNVLCIMIVALNSYTQASKHLVNTERGNLRSDVLQMDKSYQVFLPESYNYATESTYPVLYIIDGDYNFFHLTGIVESLSNVSEKTPEMIVVGISDNGNEQYRKDCTIKTEGNPNGNTKAFSAYLEKELKPEIEKKYRASTYHILAGHSLGGLFTTNVFLEKPDLFSAYIAIDPSYWWDDYEIVSRADSLIKGKQDLEAQLFITLADSKRMGVHELVGTIEKHLPDSKKWEYRYYPDEDHGSVGMISLRDGLLSVFKDWALTRDAFYKLEKSAAVMQHYIDLSTKYDTKFRLPPNLFSNFIYYYFRTHKTDDLATIEQEVKTHFPASVDDYYAKLGSYMVEKDNYTKAKEMLHQYTSTNKNAFKSYDALSKLYYKIEDYEKAIEHSEKSIQIAKELLVRQWQLNELESNFAKIKKRGK